MQYLNKIIELGLEKEKQHPLARTIRFTNSVILIVDIFILVNIITSIFYEDFRFVIVYSIHLLLLSAAWLFNRAKHYMAASAWFSSIALLFVSFYALVFKLNTNTIFFLPMLVFLQFFMFPRRAYKLIITFVGLIAISYGTIFFLHSIGGTNIFEVADKANELQKQSVAGGILFLSVAFGLYAFVTIGRAEQEVLKEKKKSDDLLHNVLPASVIERFKEDQSLLAQSFNEVTVLFADLVGFTSLSQKLSADELVQFLNSIFSQFDGLAEKYRVEKIKTIGDAYMVAGGVPISGGNHSERICYMALEMRDAIAKIHSPVADEDIHIRIGIHTGPLTAGVIGVKKFIYDLWGDTVNTASRMESYSQAGEIHVTEAVYQQNNEHFIFTKRGAMEIKGKGSMLTYFLKSAASA